MRPGYLLRQGYASIYLACRLPGSVELVFCPSAMAIALSLATLISLMTGCALFGVFLSSSYGSLLTFAVPASAYRRLYGSLLDLNIRSFIQAQEISASQCTNRNSGIYTVHTCPYGEELTTS